MELRRIDPHLLTMFNVWWYKLDAAKSDPSAAQLRRYLLAEGCKWVSGERHFRTQHQRMLNVVATFRA